MLQSLYIPSPHNYSFSLLAPTNSFFLPKPEQRSIREIVNNGKALVLWSTTNSVNNLPSFRFWLLMLGSMASPGTNQYPH